MFGVICAGRPVQTNLHALTPTHLLLPLALPINHLVVFLLPDTVLPPGHVATVHLQVPGKEWRLLGGVSAGKPSAIFKVGGGVEGGGGGEVVLGICIESGEGAAGQLASLQQGAGRSGSATTTGVAEKRVETLVLARRIIGNAFNFLSSFAEGGKGGEDVVPLKSFQEWWRKFEKKIEYDPAFLERDE